MSFRKFSPGLIALALAIGVLPAQAKKNPHYAPIRPLTPQQTELVQKSVAREKVIVKSIQTRTPLVQTYIQNMRPDPKLYTVPVSDQYVLSRVDFSKTFTAEGYKEKTQDHGFFKGSLKAITGLSKAFGISYSATGFMQMMFVDPYGYDLQHYDFAFVRQEFLGNIRTSVFDVHPKSGTGNGRFSGRVWIEDQDGNIVRFNGTYSSNGDPDSPRYYHFDSWRQEVQPTTWLPSAIYVEEARRDADHAIGVRAQTHFWGYSLKLPTRESENASIDIENATDQSDNSQDVSPLQAQRQWMTQAEQNVIDRLVQAGLVAQPSEIDKTLEQVTNNIIIGNNLPLGDAIHCRVLLTTPLESVAIGNTILLSKGLIDTLPFESDLAAVLSFQLAHIVLGHRIDTRYAFNDRLLFPDEATFSRIHMDHTAADDDAAAKKAVALLKGSIYKDHLNDVGLFFAQLIEREKQLPALTTPQIGDSLLRADGTPWLGELTNGAPKLDQDNLNQVAALPLGSRLKTDPWDDRVMNLHVKPVALLTARDKMPLEVTPVYLRLTRYAQPTAPQTTPAANPAAGDPPAQQQAQPPAPAAQDQGQPPADNQAPANPAPTTGQSNPPADNNAPSPQ
jgi:hypothetical protein